MRWSARVGQEVEGAESVYIVNCCQIFDCEVVTLQELNCVKWSQNDTIVGLHDIARLILILYCIVSIFKTIIVTISRLWCQECKESCLENNLPFSNCNNLSK